ncbi:hypothetical protein DRJ22_01830 [Candidatus Woesearchaeota archaeon]|nr:MAG: hypothetical protein B6U93_02335 [Candidatus Woesearchaeota archaeon ex4484_78]RLE46493.1 MAG: hypothetical protein DRJ22_01830 [Candidatus Woesearchaeota archaeon]
MPIYIEKNMSVIGMQFNKIIIEKTNPVKGKISVKNNVALEKVEKHEVPVGTSKQTTARFHFKFTASYEPKIASITLKGFLTWFDKKEKIEELAKTWSKDKKIDKEIMTEVLNTILGKCNIEALVLAREVNLPPPIPLPKVSIKQ